VGNDVVVEVGGIGYRVSVPDRLALGLRDGEEVLLHTAFVVRDDSVALFGFDTPDELLMFDLLRGVSGVGPKSAMAVLSQLSSADIHDAVASENDAAFRAVSGIGPKTAKLIVLSLTGVIERRAPRAADPSSRDVPEAVKVAVVQALIGLGWSDRVAKSGVAMAIEESPEAAVDAAALLRLALTILGPQISREGGS
jgi:Holliday junction DNA helicase RuvA